MDQEQRDITTCHQLLTVLPLSTQSSTSGIRLVGYYVLHVTPYSDFCPFFAESWADAGKWVTSRRAMPNRITFVQECLLFLFTKKKGYKNEFTTKDDLR